MILLKEIKNQSNSLAVYIKWSQERERDLLKEHIPGRRWDKENKHWIIPYTQDTLEKIDQVFVKEYRLDFTIKPTIPLRYEGPFYINQKPKKVAVKKEKLKHYKAIEAVEQDLILRRYSIATIKYLNENNRHFLMSLILC